MKRTDFRWVVAAAAAVVGACSPNAESEIKHWQHQQQAVVDYGTRWPGLKEVLESQKAKAQPIWDEASKLADAKQKAEKMKQANEVLAALVNKIDQVKYKSEAVQSGIAKLNGLKLTRSQDSQRQTAIDEANHALEEVESAMRGATPKMMGEAEQTLDAQVDRLIAANGTLDRAYNALKPAKATKKK